MSECGQRPSDTMTRGPVLVCFVQSEAVCVAVGSRERHWHLLMLGPTALRRCAPGLCCSSEFADLRCVEVVGEADPQAA